jgi:hypothetical protein
MRALSSMFVLVLVLTTPSLAGSDDGDLPGAGTFAYSGFPILSPAPAILAVGQRTTVTRPLNDKG